MSLDLSLDNILPPHARGRKEKSVVASKVRDLTSEDIQKLHEVKEGALGKEVRIIKKLRDAHHTLARLVSEGRPNEEISQITGYDPAYISNIRNHDPAFRNLVDYYKGQINEAFATVHERMATVSTLAAEELQDRLTEEPEGFSNRELLEVLEKTADRTGFGPQTRNVNLNVNVDLASRLENARKRAGIGTEHPPPNVLDSVPIAAESSPSPRLALSGPLLEKV